MDKSCHLSAKRWRMTSKKNFCRLTVVDCRWQYSILELIQCQFNEIQFQFNFNEMKNNVNPRLIQSICNRVQPTYAAEHYADSPSSVGGVTSPTSGLVRWMFKKSPRSYRAVIPTKTQTFPTQLRKFYPHTVQDRQWIEIELDWIGLNWHWIGIEFQHWILPQSAFQGVHNLKRNKLYETFSTKTFLAGLFSPFRFLWFMKKGNESLLFYNLIREQ